MTPIETATKLPRGVWFERNRNRYRVRIYKNKQVFHISYHRTLGEALSIFNRIKNLPEHPVGALDEMFEQTDIYYKSAKNQR
jgi:hypothetical protein